MEKWKRERRDDRNLGGINSMVIKDDYEKSRKGKWRENEGWFNRIKGNEKRRDVRKKWNED